MQIYHILITAWTLLMFTPVVAQRSAAPEKLFAQGVEALKNDRLDEAEKFLQEAQKSGGESLLILHHLAVIQQQRGKHTKAVAQFREVIRWQPDNGTAHLLLGISLTALDKKTEALTALHKAAKFLPQQSEARRQLAKAYERLDAWSGVIEQYQLLSELEPDNAEYAYQLGRAYNKLAEWSQLEIIRLNPNAARIHQALGQNYLVQGRNDLALLSFQKAAKADPKLTEIHLAIALILLEQKLYEEALHEIALELKLVPESIKALEVKKQIESARQSGQ